MEQGVPLGLTMFDASEEDGTKAQPLYERLAFDRLELFHSGEGSLEFEDAEPHPPAERMRDTVVLLGQEGTDPHPGDGKDADPHPPAERLCDAVVPLGQEDAESHPGDDGHPLRETSEEGEEIFPNQVLI